MPYTSKQEMIDRFGADELIQLTDRASPSTGAISDTVLNQALADADSEADGYLGARYTLPLATVPVALKRIAADIARYRLYDNAATEEVRKRYEDAIKFLRAVSSGEATLGIDPVRIEDAPQYSAPVRVFSGDTLKDF